MHFSYFYHFIFFILQIEQNEQKRKEVDSRGHCMVAFKQHRTEIGYMSVAVDLVNICLPFISCDLNLDGFSCTLNLF